MKIIAVTGPPCAGKSSYVAQHRDPDHVVIDLDALAHALGYPDPHLDWNGDDHPARHVAMRARASAIKAARDLPLVSVAWVITTAPDPRALNARETVALDPGADECHRRAAIDERPTATHEQIDQWYDRHASSRTW